MAKPPSELSWLIDYGSSRRTYRALSAAGLLTPEAARDRRAILAALDHWIAYPPNDMTLGGRTLDAEFMNVLWPYLAEKGREMATTTGLIPPPTPRRAWWRFWTWFGQTRPATYPPVPADCRVLFYRRDRASFGFLSNFYPARFLLEARVWPTAEHFYQAQKSFDQAYQEAVWAAATPGQAKRLGAAPGGPRKAAKQSWFRKTGTVPRSDWDAVKLGVMRQAVAAKFDQNPDLADRLRATGAAELVEDSDTDAFWGVGADGTGQNWLGRVLMETRATLR